MNLNFMVHTRIDRIYYVTEHDLSWAQAIIDFFKNSAHEYCSRNYCKSWTLLSTPARASRIIHELWRIVHELYSWISSWTIHEDPMKLKLDIMKSWILFMKPRFKNIHEQWGFHEQAWELHCSGQRAWTFMNVQEDDWNTK